MVFLLSWDVPCTCILYKSLMCYTLKFSAFHLWPTIKSNNAGLPSLKIEWRGKYRCCSESCFKSNNSIPGASREHGEWKIIRWAATTINMPIEWARTYTFSWPGKRKCLPHCVHGTELTKQFIKHDSSFLNVSQLVLGRFQWLCKKGMCHYDPEIVFRVI